MEEFYQDLALAYRGAVQAFADAGCRYLQLDEVNLAYLCDAEQRQILSERGDDPDPFPESMREMINTAIADRPADMVITMHLCRGNFRSAGSRKAATSRSLRSCSTRSTSTDTSWSTTPNARAASNRCALCRKKNGGAWPGDFQERRAGIER